MNINKIKTLLAAFFAGIAASFAAVFLFDRRRKVDGRETGKAAEDARRREIEKTDSSVLTASSGNADELRGAREAIKEDTARRIRDRVKAELHRGGAETIVGIFFEETESGIERAFNEGYKQGVLEYAPKAAGLEAIRKDLQAECRKIKARRVVQDVGIGLGCFAAGFMTSELIQAVR